MKRARITVEPREAMLLVTATGFEQAYFDQMKKDCRYTSLTVKCSSKASSIMDLISFATKSRTAGKFQSVYIFFAYADFEALSVEDIKAASLVAEKKRMHLIWTIPSLSMWFYMHFKSLESYVSKPEVFNDALSKVFPGFREDAEYFSTEGQNFHLKLFSSFSKALANLSAYNRISVAKTGIPASNMMDLYTEINRVCGSADITHNQKTLAKK